MPQTKRDPLAPASRWPCRLALATLLAAVPLVFFGGTVTTLHAGLAIDGWLILEPGRGDHFLWLYPVDKWFRDLGTFVEHTHRLFGSLVGLLAIATVVATWATDSRKLTRTLSVAALLAVIAQGTIGGLRVLEQSEGLAFLHGAIAQGVFAVLGASYVASSARFAALGRSANVDPSNPAARLRGLSVLAAGVIYFQIVAGAWLRHGGRIPALALHGMLALAAIVCTWLLGREMRIHAARLREDARSRILALRRWVIGLVSAQMALGFAAFVVVWCVVGPDSRTQGSLGSSVFPTLHVLVGGALFFACVASAMSIHRLFPSPLRSSSARIELEPVR